MAKAFIDSDEWYPVYVVRYAPEGAQSDEWDRVNDIPDATLARWQAVRDAFEAVQDEMKIARDGVAEE